MTKYYIEFKTWAEGTFDVPFPYVFFQHTDDYRNRKNLPTKIPASKVKGIFLKFDDAESNKFLVDHVSGIILGAIADSDSAQNALNYISSIFGYSEFIGVCEVTDSNKEMIGNIIRNDQSKEKAE